MFFKNRSINIKLAKDNPNPDGSLPLIEVDPMVGPQIAAAYAEVAKDFITHAAVTIGATYAICKIIGKICK